MLNYEATFSNSSCSGSGSGSNSSSTDGTDWLMVQIRNVKGRDETNYANC